MNSGKSCLEEVSQLLTYQVALINQYWVRLHGDFREKNATMILASSTKMKNSFASIFGCVELLLFSFNCRKVDNACLKSDLCRIGIVSESMLFQVIVNFLWSQMVGVIFVRKIIHLATKIFASTNFNHIPSEFVISYKSIVDTLEVLLLALLLELMGDVVFSVSLASSRNDAREGRPCFI